MEALQSFVLSVRFLQICADGTLQFCHPSCWPGSLGVLRKSCLVPYVRQGGTLRYVLPFAVSRKRNGWSSLVSLSSEALRVCSKVMNMFQSQGCSIEVLSGPHIADLETTRWSFCGPCPLSSSSEKPRRYLRFRILRIVTQLSAAILATFRTLQDTYLARTDGPGDVC